LYEFQSQTPYRRCLRNAQAWIAREGQCLRTESPAGQAAKAWRRFIKCAISEKDNNRTASWTGIESKVTGSNSKARPKEKWGRLTDDDLDVINGRQEQLEGKIQERYGLAKDHAKKEVETWYSSLP
jgi:uncharacterized protein YjbJ (UPF0337 family)